jgi:hypothetical protein
MKCDFGSCSEDATITVVTDEVRGTARHLCDRCYKILKAISRDLAERGGF